MCLRELPMTLKRRKLNVFIYLDLTHQWPYKFNKPQWPYHGLSDWGFFLRHFTTGRQWPYHGLTNQVFLNQICETVVWSLTFRVENVFGKKKRSVRPWYGHWPTRSKTWFKKMIRSVRQGYGHWRVKAMKEQIIRAAAAN